MKIRLLVQTPYKRRLASLVDRLMRLLYWLIGRRATKPADLATADLRHIVVLRLDHVGDVLLSTPVYRALRQRFPAARLTAIVGPWSRGLLEVNPHLDEVLVLSVPWWANVRDGIGLVARLRNWLQFPLHWWGVVRRVRRSGVDLVIDLRADLRQIVCLVSTIGAPYRLSYRRSGGDVLLTHALSFPSAVDEVAKNLGLLAPLGISDAETTLELHVGAPAVAAAEACLMSVGIAPQTKLLLVHPGGRTTVRRWPTHNYAMVAERLAREHDLVVCVIGSNDERETCAALSRLLTVTHFDLCGRTSLVELAALLQAARLFIGADSGPCHLAVAVGTPSVVLYGPTPPEAIRPAGAHEARLYVRYPCSPCLQVRCEAWDKPWGKCLDDLGTEAVYQRADRLLSETAGAAPRRPDQLKIPPS